MNHEVFQKPYAVRPTLVDLPTPVHYFRSRAGVGLGATMPMWRVETVGYGSGADVMIGLVSRDRGFGDSPDTEWISGGVNSKRPNAVAIGRHGNFMLWGFAASPTYLTAEAKLLLVNCLHYIARFAGTTPVVRKGSGIVLREDLEWYSQRLREPGWAQWRAAWEKKRVAHAQLQAAVRRRLKAGEEVSEVERRVLRDKGIGSPERTSWARGYFSKEDWALVQNDPERIAAHLSENAAYFRPASRFQLEVDTDLKTLGIANNDREFLPKILALLDDPGQAAVGMRILQRYTTERFATAAAWRSWWKKHQKRFFFSETAGYRWLVDAPSAEVPRAVDAAAPGGFVPSRAEPLVWRGGLRELPRSKAGRRRVQATVSLRVLEGWHAYDIVPAGQPYAPLAVQLQLPPGVSRVGDWRRPESKADTQVEGLLLFEGALEFQLTLEVRAGVRLTAGIPCTVSYQVCDQEMCLPATSGDAVLRLGSAGRR